MHVAECLQASRVLVEAQVRDRSIHVEAAGRVRGLTEEHISQLMEELAPCSAALGFHTERGSVGATLTVFAGCSDDAVFLGAEIFRSALCVVGIDWKGEIK